MVVMQQSFVGHVFPYDADTLASALELVRKDNRTVKDAKVDLVDSDEIKLDDLLSEKQEGVLGDCGGSQSVFEQPKAST